MFPFLTSPPILQDGFDPITEPELNRVMRAVGISLPASHVNLLLCQNGGRFAQLTVGGTESQTHVQSIYAVTPDSEYCELSRAVRTSISLVGRSYVPFGDSGLGRYLVVRNGAKADSPVYALDCATMALELVAGGLMEFFRSLRYSPAQDELWVETMPPFTLIERGEMPSIEEFGDLLKIRNQFGQSALACAAASLQPRMVEALLDMGANPDDVDESGETPLMLAAQNDAFEICRTLVERGADLRIRNHEGMTALELAQRDDNRRVSRLLFCGA